MRLNRAEWIMIAVTAVLLALMAGRYWGGESARQILRQSAPAAALESILPSEGGAPEKPEPSGPLDLNTATVEELTALPGIGEGRARAIVEWREEHGPFRYAEDLVQIPGIGEGLFAQLEEYVTVGGN